MEFILNNLIEIVSLLIAFASFNVCNFNRVESRTWSGTTDATGSGASSGISLHYDIRN